MHFSVVILRDLPSSSLVDCLRVFALRAPSAKILPMQVSVQPLLWEFPEGREGPENITKWETGGQVWLPSRGRTEVVLVTGWCQGELHEGGGLARSLQRKGPLGGGPWDLCPSPRRCCLWRAWGSVVWPGGLACRSAYSRAGNPHEAALMSCRSCSRPTATTRSSSRSLQSWCWKSPSGTPSKRPGVGRGRGREFTPCPSLPDPGAPSCLSSPDRGWKGVLVPILTMGPRQGGFPRDQ